MKPIVKKYQLVVLLEKTTTHVDIFSTGF